MSRCGGRDYTVIVPCRWEDAAGEPCERDVRITLGEGGGVDDADFTCAHEAAITGDPKMAADMAAEALGAYTDKIEQLYDAHVDAQIDRRRDREMGW